MSKKLSFELIRDVNIDLPCSVCGSELIINDEEIIVCGSCNQRYENLADCLAQDENSVISDKFKQVTSTNNAVNKSCPSCWENTLVYQEHEDTWFCIVCFEKYTSFECDCCGGVIPDAGSYKKIHERQNEEGDMEYESICSDCAENEVLVVVE